MFSQNFSALEPENTAKAAWLANPASYQTFEHYIFNERAVGEDLTPHIEDFFNKNRVLLQAFSTSATLPLPVPLSRRGLYNHAMNMLATRLAEIFMLPIIFVQTLLPSLIFSFGKIKWETFSAMTQ